jgi:two-component system, chemotaxis family, CheB/CheR fusion protein
MNETSVHAAKSVATELLPDDEMDTGLLERGKGKIPIVGLGCSAGGIAALHEFFAAMPADPGIAFVVVMHLSPHHDSSLVEMFQRITAMSVVVAKDSVQVEPNFVYVIPPGKFIALVDGHLSLTEAKAPRGKRITVDYFFRTLAETHGAQSVAVVLSGAGADGALGLKRIKELGGLTIAQDPDEAEHADMPRSAIATGVVDWVLGVKEMPLKLLAYVRQREALALSGEDVHAAAETAEQAADQYDESLSDVLAFLHTRTGRDFSCYKRATILRRLSRRMQVNGLVDLESYLAYLRTHTGEAGALLQDLLISVTNFFRDPSAFAALESTIPELFKGKGPGDTVRVWVAGCATGEEAYSIAMLLSEHAATLVGPPQLQVFATDLDEDVIREAREGFYPDTIAADVSEERLRHFFIHEPGGYRVRRPVRELVLFAPHDLLKDSPFSRLDLVSCRNLLIYLKREAQTRAFDIFHFALRSGGKLFLGTSEAVDEGSPLFSVLDKKHRLYTQHPGPQRVIGMPQGPGTLARSLALHERTKERPAVPRQLAFENVQSDLDRSVPLESSLSPGELHYKLIERFSPPSILVNSQHDIVHLSESAGRFLQFTGGEPTRNLLRIVQPMLRVELRAALYAAAKTGTLANAYRVPMEIGQARSLVDIRVTAAGDIAPQFLLIVFEEHAADQSTSFAEPRSADADQVALHLERELIETKARLRETIEESEASTEELKASNEELQAMNEELRSATEELETSREELQSINEELNIVNDELKIKIDQLARTNNDLQNLMSATDIATVFLDRELCIQRFTPSAKTLFNFISADLGRPLADLSRRLDYPDIVVDAERSLEQLQPSQREVRAGDHWFIARTLPYRTEDDHIAGIVLTFLDITEQRRAAEEIARLSAESERQRRMYETVLTNTPDFIYVFSLDYKVLYANESLLKMWGCGREGAIGKTFLEIGYEPWHAEMHNREIDQVRATREPIRGEVPFNGTNGRRQYDYIFVPVIDANGEVVAVAGTTRDVTDRIETERQLREGQEQLDFALAAADLGQWALNLTDNTVTRTPRHDQLFGYGTLLPEWSYQRFLEHVVPADRLSVNKEFERSLASGLPWAIECRIRRADGALRYMWIKGQVRRDRGGQIDSMVGIIGDITDRRQAADRQAFQLRLAETLRPLSNAVDVQAEASKMLGEHLGASRVVYFEIRGDEYLIERDYTAGVQALVGRYPVSSFGSALLTELLNGRTVIESDATTQFNRSSSEQAAFAAIQVRGHVDVPLVKEGRFVAGMTVHVSEPREWTAQEVALIEDTAERTWAAVERVRAELALQQSEERLAFVRRSSGVGFWYCDLPFDVLQWDDIVKGHFHLAPDAEVTIETFYDRIHPDDREPTRQAIEISIAQRTAYRVDYRTVHPDTGAIKWVRAIGRTFYAADGTPIRFDGVTLDVSEQKLAEASLRESEQRFRLVADAAPVMIWKSGTDKLVYWYNRPWLEFTGRSMEQEIGHGAAEVIHPDDIERSVQTYSDAFDARQPFSMEYRLRRYDGEYRWMISNGIPRYRADGEFDGYIGSCFDVTDYKNAQLALRDADRRKDEFLATLSHELRNPLAPIRSGLQLIRMVGVDGTVEQARAMMERQLSQMTRLVDDLLDVSRVTTGKFTLRKETLELRGVIEASLETCRPVIEQHGHQLDVSVPDQQMLVEGDPVRLAQIMSNLLTNSAKYTQRGGRIRVSVTREDATALLVVSDNGIGIPPHMLKSVFGMFTQVNQTLEKTSGGLGVGLALAKGLVEMHGGTIEAHSQGDGQGSEFIVRLPLAPSVNDKLISTTSKEPDSQPKIARVLVVDDNADAADVLGEILKMMGNEVLTVYDGESAIKAASEFKPNVVLCDIGMPKMNGYDTARRIRAEEWGRNAVLVALTGWGQKEDRQKSAEAGFDHHLVKPVEVDAVIALLSGL